MKERLTITGDDYATRLGNFFPDTRHPEFMVYLYCAMDCGSERILFGSDLPWFDTHHGIGTVLATDMRDEDRRNIFYRNGEKLMARMKQR